VNVATHNDHGGGPRAFRETGQQYTGTGPGHDLGALGPWSLVANGTALLRAVVRGGGRGRGVSMCKSTLYATLPKYPLPAKNMDYTAVLFCRHVNRADLSDFKQGLDRVPTGRIRLM
jgi:hypothetical protein